MNKQVIANLNLLAKECPEKVTVRIPVIPDFNDSIERAKTMLIMEEMGFQTNLFEYTLDVNDFKDN